MITDIPCVILSGGKSSRMGEDKSLLPFENFNTLIEYQHNKLSKIFSTVYISTKTDKFNFNSNLIFDNQLDISSPMVALESIFEQLDCDKIFIITVDIPFVEESTIKHLVDYASNYEIVIAQDDQRIHTLCGVFSKSILKNINDLIKKDIHKINYLIKQTNNNKKLYFSKKKQFLNLNSIDEYQEALDIIRSNIKH